MPKTDEIQSNFDKIKKQMEEQKNRAEQSKGEEHSNAAITSNINSNSNSIVIQKGDKRDFYQRYQQKNVWLDKDLVRQMERFCKSNNITQMEAYDTAFRYFLDNVKVE